MEKLYERELRAERQERVSRRAQEAAQRVMKAQAHGAVAFT